MTDRSLGHGRGFDATRPIPVEVPVAHAILPILLGDVDKLVEHQSRRFLARLGQEQDELFATGIIRPKASSCNE